MKARHGMAMRNSTSIAQMLVTLAAVGTVSTSIAQSSPPPGKSLGASAGIFVYPAKGQTADKQAQDEAQCYNWARDQSGYDPMSPPPPPAQAAAAQPQKPAADGSRARGALRGAAAGAVIGEVADNDAGKGAAIGATLGVLAGGRKSRMAQSQQQQQAQAQATASAEQSKAAQQELANSFKRGMSACLEARGYTAK